MGESPYCGVKCKLCFGGPPDTETPPYVPPEGNNTMSAAKSNEDLRAMSERESALETLGTIDIPETAGRDAIHIAVVSAVAESKVYPGQHVGKDGDPFSEKTVGIVDPYLKAPVYPGQRFWILLYPRTITGLRHVWTHPDFEDESGRNVQIIEKEVQVNEWGVRVTPEVEKARDTILEIMEYAGAGSRYKDFVDTVMNGVGYDDEYLTIYGVEARGDIPHNLWDAIEIVTGKVLPEGEKPKYFACSC